MDLMEDPKFCEFIAAFGKLMQSTQEVSLEEARRQSTAFFCPPSLIAEEVHQILDLKIKGQEGNDIPIRLYSPSAEKGLPLFIYYHRGGWIFGNIEEADAVCRKLANHLECIVASVEYRLAPENPFPKPLNDCYDALCYLSAHAEFFGGNSEKILVGGESAGGNLAAATSLMARDKEGPAIALQLLLYPIISSTIEENAYIHCADQFFLTQSAMQFMWSMYLQEVADADNGYASPEKAPHLEKLPKALIITAEHDPLHLEAENYASLLQKAGNTVVVKRFSGVIHGFLDLPIYSNLESIAWIQSIGVELQALLESNLDDEKDQNSLEKLPTKMATSR